MKKQIGMTLLTGFLLGSACGETAVPFAAGKSVPPLVLRTAADDPFDLNAAIKQRPVVLIFYRGGWCPYCNAHLAQLQTIEPQPVEMGYQILAISPDRPAKLAESIGKEQLSYTLLSDSSMEVAKAFGLAFEVDADWLELNWKREKEIMFSEGGLDRKTRELIAMAVSMVNPCEYCMLAHETMARSAGATDKELGQVVQIIDLFSSFNAIADALHIPCDIKPEQ